MLRMLFATALTLASASALADQVGISLNVNQPGFFGRLEIGNEMQPEVINREPVMIEPAPMNRPPVYLRVPPEHARHWRDYCRQYHACGERVYFVSEDWYNRRYAAPRVQERPIYVGDPGFFGRLDIGGFPQPEVINHDPIAISAVPADRPPVYFYVPLEHAIEWSKYCNKYHACDQWVFFVPGEWYNRTYVPRYRQLHPY